MMVLLLLGGVSIGGDSSAVSSSLSSGVINIFTNHHAFVALKDDGSVVTWGDDFCGGDSSSVSSSLSSGVVKVYSTYHTFAALKDDGSVVTWGNSSYGGNSSSVSSSLSSGVVKVFSTAYAFSALKDNGSVVTWGDSSYGGDSSAVSSSLSSGVVKVFSNNRAFAALKNDGSVVTWGNSSYGGDSSSVSSSLSSGVVKVFSNNRAFAALKDDASVVTWGNSSHGGDSSAVSSSLSSGVYCIQSIYEDCSVGLISRAGFDKTTHLYVNVTLDGSSSSTSKGTIVSYEWKEGETVLSTESIFSKSDFSFGTHILTLTVTDNEGVMDTDTVIVEIIRDPSLTYSWKTEKWGKCKGTCGETNVFRTRAVQCIASNNELVSNSICTGTKPITSETCTYSICRTPIAKIEGNDLTADEEGNLTVEGGTPISFDGSSSSNSDGFFMHYKWTDNIIGKFSQVKITSPRVFSIGTHIVNLTLTTMDGYSATDTIEFEVIKPTYSWKIAEWGICEGICGTNNVFKTRVVECISSANIIVNDSLCSGTKPETSQSCSDLECLTPIPKAGSDQTTDEYISVTLDASDSYVNNGIIVSYEWKEDTIVLSREAIFSKSDFSVGTHTLTLTVTDDKGLYASDTVLVVVEESTYTWLAGEWGICHGGGCSTNSATQTRMVQCISIINNIVNDNACTEPKPASSQSCPDSSCKIFPVSNTGSDQIVDQYIDVTFDGSDSFHSDGIIATYQWKEGNTILSNSHKFSKAGFSLGTHTITLTVTDTSGLSNTDTMIVTVIEDDSITYSWVTGEWSECSGVCGTENTIKSRVVQCVSSNNKIVSDIVSDTVCSETKPITSRPCTDIECRTPVAVAQLGHIGEDRLVTLYGFGSFNLNPEGDMLYYWEEDNIVFSRSMDPLEKIFSPGLHIITLRVSDLEERSSTDTLTFIVQGPISYSWRTEDWGSCQGECGTNNATQTRIVQCKSSLKEIVSDTQCSEVKPITSQVCTESLCNIFPIANAGSDQIVEKGDIVTLDASNSSDSDGTIVSYSWKKGSTILSSLSSFNKSDFSVGTHTLTLTVIDDEGLVSTDTVHINIIDTDKDDDNDTMPDMYEKANGLNPLLDDSNLDLDKDGKTNLEEYQDNTNPNDKYSKIFTLNLKTGWNLISLELNSSVILNTLNNQDIEIVRSLQNNTWKIWESNSSSNTISTLEDGYGYWIKVSQNTTIDITGERVADQISPDQNQWNMLGSQTITDIDQFFTNNQNTKIIWTYKDGDYKAVSNDTNIQNDLDNKNIPIIQSIESNEGFFVK